MGCRPHLEGLAGDGGWRLIGCLPDLRDEPIAGLWWWNGGIRRGLLDGMHDARVRAEEAGGLSRRCQGWLLSTRYAGTLCTRSMLGVLDPRLVTVRVSRIGER